MSKRRKDAGQALAVVALGMVVLLGFLGLGIDMGYLRYMKRKMQMLADTAAIAAATELTQCTASPCTPLTAAAQDALTENGFSGSTLVTNSSTCVGTSGLTIVVNNGPLCLGSKTADPNYQNSSFVEVEVSQVEPLAFATIFGVSTATVSARAEASLPGGGSCMFTLGTTGADVTLVFALQYNSQCGWVDESTSSNAFSGLLGFYDLPYFGIVGGNSCFLCFAVGGGASPTTGITTPTPADPLAYLQPNLASEAPSPTACGTSTSSPYTGHNGPLTIGTGSAVSATLNPGTYCGGITIGPGATITMNSGIYTLTSTSASNGGLSIDALTTVTGNGVGFYNYGTYGAINFTFPSATPGAVTLTAPNATNCSTCGSAWQGILFYQPPTNTTASTVIGSAFWNTKLTGTSYFPDASLTYALDATVNYNEVVAKTVTMGLAIDGQNVVTNFNNNFSELANGNPIKASGAVLGE